ncbi:30S ribosomal protein S13 [Desulfolithobacter dissulfuricans]|uniref:Small ribosomal subunit protein uS13 n=1 Tax=Desulfolithobacter dissulfuricans TaxID=2795293 RepID=A0A915U259_9BACT|nr:30S ribosomal protein S13 [Desulfolithobacter dissulfuricans]BCO09948.1 30S ribosomal protein S13 [Desulfolithobacter dissulfuricans]
MARIAGVDLPRNKHMDRALTYIYGIGLSTAREILDKADLPYQMNSDDLSGDDVTRIRKIIEADYEVEGDRRRKVSMDIKRLMDIGCYRGRRHRMSLPCRGQRTKTNARTRKGPRRGAAVRKK